MDNERIKQETKVQDEKVIFNFKENINNALIEHDWKKVSILTNSYALYMNTLFDIIDYSKRKSK